MSNHSKQIHFDTPENSNQLKTDVWTPGSSCCTKSHVYVLSGIKWESKEKKTYINKV